MTSNLSDRRGFSLIEILIVLAIIGLIVVTLSSRIGKDNRKIRRDVRVFSSQLRELRNKARMRNQTYRMVINLPENKAEKQSYWVESSSQKALVTYNEELIKKRQEFLTDEEKKAKKDGSGFEIDSEISKEGPQPLPDGLYFDSVEIASQKKEFTSGRIFIHFFPEGRVEEAVIHLTDRARLNWTLAIHPLTGRVDLLTSNKKLKELQETPN